MRANIDPLINNVYSDGSCSVPSASNAITKDKKYPTRAHRNLAPLNAINTTFLATTPKGD